MSRSILIHAVIAATDLSTNRNVESGVSVYVCQRNSTDLITQTMYQSDTGVTTLSNPLTSDASGYVKAYALHAEDVDLRIGSLTATPVASKFIESPAGPRPHIDAAAAGIRPENSSATNTANWTTLTANLTHGDTVVFPRGTCHFTDTMTVTGLDYVTLKGYGDHASILQQGTTGKCGIILDGCSYSRIEGLRLVGPSSTPSVGLDVTESAVRIITSSGSADHNTVEGCTMTDWGSIAVDTAGDYTKIIRNTATGKDPNPIVEPHCGIRITGNYALVDGNFMELFSNNCNVNGTNPIGYRIVNNQFLNARNVNLYTASSSYASILGNRIWNDSTGGAGIKIGFTSYNTVIANNTLYNTNIWANHVYGIVIEGNTIDGSSIVLNCDNNDNLQAVKSAVVRGNTIRNTPYATDGAQVLGAITARGRNVLIDGNIIAWSQGNGITFYAPDGTGILGIEIKHNIIRMCGLHATNTLSGIQMGGGYSEDLTGLRITGNTITSKDRPATASVTTTITSPTVTGLSAAELNLFEVGDTVTGGNIPASTTIITPMNAVSGTVTLSQNATASGADTMTLATPQMKYGILIGSGSTGEIEVWGNTFRGIGTANMALGETVTRRGLSIGTGIRMTAEDLTTTNDYGAPMLLSFQSTVDATAVGLEVHPVTLGAGTHEVRVYAFDGTYNDGVFILELFGSDASGNHAQYHRGVTTCVAGTPTDAAPLTAGSGVFSVGASSYNGGGAYYTITVTRSTGVCGGFVTTYGQAWGGVDKVKVV